MTSYVFDRETMKLVPRETYYRRKAKKAAKKWGDVAMPYVRGDLPEYISPVTRKPVRGRAERREDLARSGCREVDPSEFKPIYRNYEFCQRKRLLYMGGDVPPPMSQDEKAYAQERKSKRQFAEAAAEAVRAARAAESEPPAPLVRGNPRTAPVAKIRL